MVCLVEVKEGKLITTSKVIGDVFGKSHRKVMRDISELDCSDEFRAANFGLSSYTTSQNKNLKCFEVTRDGMAFLCMGFTGKKAAAWKEKYITAFNEMEKGLLNIDARMNRLTIEGEDIKQAGKEWSSFGREVNRQKKGHTKKVDDLLNEVQCKLDFSK